MRVRGNEAGGDDPARPLRADATGGSLKLHDGLGRGARAWALEDARVRRWERALESREQRERVEPVQRLQDAVGRHRAQETRQDRRPPDLGSQSERRLVEGEDGQEPADSQGNEASERDAADSVERGQRRVGGEEHPHGARERSGGEAE